MADELGALEKEFAPYQPKLDRIKLLKEQLRAAFDNRSAGDSIEVYGEHFIVSLGPRANERSISIAKLVKAVGAKVFAKFAKCTLKDLEANVGPEVIAAVVTSDLTGTRPLKTFERGKAA
jgi:hypothetical protein